MGGLIVLLVSIFIIYVGYNLATKKTEVKDTKPRPTPTPENTPEEEPIELPKNPKIRE